MKSTKKDYESVLAALEDHITLASRINKLNKVWISTEDEKLRKALGQLVGYFKKTLSVTQKDMAHSLIADDKRFQPIKNYCAACIASEKPTWRILAEQNGWGPK